MTDIVTLGLAVDTRGAVASLDRFTVAGKGAGASATALEKAVAGVGKATGGLDAVSRSAVSTTTALGKAANDSAKSHAGLNAQAQAAGHSIRSMVESLASGMPVSQTLTQQIGHLSFAATGPGGLSGAFKQAGGALAGLVTPVTAVVGGIAAVAAVGYTLYNSLSQSALAADNLAKSAGTTISAIRGFQTLASFKGIDTEESAKAMAQFARNVYDAKSGMGGLADMFRANNMQARDYNGYLDGASTLIRRATGDTQKQFSILTQMGLPATQKWVDLLQQGGDALRKAINANGTNDSAEGKLAEAARKFDEAWNKATTNTGNYIKSWALSAYSALDSLVEKAVNGAGSFTRALAGQPEPDKPRARILITGGTTEKPPIDPAVAAHALSIEQARLGVLGQVATVNEQVRASEIAIAQARAGGAKISDADVKRVQDYAKANALGLVQIRATTDAYNVETSTLGMTTGAAAAYTAEQTKINDEKRKGNTLSALQLADLRNTSAALGEAAQRSENMRFGYDSLTNAGSTFASSIRNGASALDSLKAAGTSALDALSQKLMKMATDNLWSSAFGGSSSGGLGGLLGGIFGGGSSVNANGSIAGAVGPTSVGGAALVGIHHTGYSPGDSFSTRSVDPRLFDHAPRFHSGIGPGERAAIIRNDESVLTPGQMKAVGGAGGAITINMPINIDATGADPAGLSRVQQQVAALTTSIPARVVAAVTTARKQRQL